MLFTVNRKKKKTVKIGVLQGYRSLRPLRRGRVFVAFGITVVTYSAMADVDIYEEAGAAHCSRNKVNRGVGARP